MKQRSLLGGLTLTAGACLALSLPALAARPPVYVEVPLNVSLSNGTSDGVLGDGLYSNGTDNVRAVLLANSNGNFVFDTNDQPGPDGGRRLVLDFHGQATPFPSAVPLYVDAFIGTLPVENSPAPDNLQTMRMNDVLQRRARLAWVDGSQQYSLRWDGQNGHSVLSVRCTNDDGAARPSCTDWTITSEGSVALCSIPTKGKEVDTCYASVSMPFTMTLTRK